MRERLHPPSPTLHPLQHIRTPPRPLPLHCTKLPQSTPTWPLSGIGPHQLHISHASRSQGVCAASPPTPLPLSPHPLRSLQWAVAPTWPDMGFIRQDSSEDMCRSFIFSFLSLQLLILHSYLLGTSVVCLLAGKLKKKKGCERASGRQRERERETLQPSCMWWAFTALLISFKIVFSENRKNVGFNISHSPLHLDRGVARQHVALRRLMCVSTLQMALILGALTAALPAEVASSR